MNTKKIITLVLLCIFALGAFATKIEKSNDGKSYIVSGDNYTLHFDAFSGAITRVVSDNKDMQITAPEGLWIATFKDNSQIAATSAKCNAISFNDKIIFKYTTEQIDVVASVIPQKNYCDFKADINLKNGVLSCFQLPATIRFPVSAVDEIHLQTSSPHTSGIVLSKEFFNARQYYKMSEPQKTDAYKKIFGTNAIFSALDKTENPKKAKDTDAWLSKKTIDLFSKKNIRASRTMPFEKTDIHILNSDNGVFIGGTKLGGKGAFFRIGGWIEDGFINYKHLRILIADIIKTAQKISKKETSSRKKIGIVSINGVNCFFDEWHSDFSEMFPNLEIIEPEQLKQALADPEFLFIVNPYNDICPTPPNTSILETADMIFAYVKNGGFWFDSTGLSFYRGVEKSGFLKITGKCPPSIADFFHIKNNKALLAYYSVQDIKDASFENPTKSFIPSFFEITADSSGGLLQRPFKQYMKAPYKWSTPIVRFDFGKNLQQSVDAFCIANNVTKTLQEKLDKQTLAKLANSVLLNLWTKPLSDLERLTNMMPKNNLVHVSTYLYGGHDYQYPEHFPPNPSFSSADEFKDYLKRVRQSGHLFMPYTNYTFWGDKPRSPTLLDCGEGVISIRPDGKQYHECYGGIKFGFNVTQWHPAAQKASLKIMKDWSEEYECDFVFQDQLGARPSILDFNPHLPNPNRYTDGLIFTARRDCKIKPLSTEDGFWAIANEEFQFCGLSFGISHERANFHNTRVWHILPKNGVRLANLTSMFFGDKVVLSHHNIDRGINTDRQLALTLGIGYSTMISIFGSNSYTSERKAFLEWMDCLQKKIVSKYIGKKMKSFKHWWLEEDSKDGEGFIKAQYGEVKIFANMTHKTYKLGNVVIASDGLYASSKTAVAGLVNSINGIKVSRRCGFVVEGNNVGIYSYTGADAIFPSKKKIQSLTTSDGTSIAFTQEKGVVKFKLPTTKLGNNKKIFLNLQAK